MRSYLLTAAVLVLCLGASAEEAKKEAGKVEEGKPAPDFTLKQTVPGDKGGKEAKLSDYFKGDKPKNVVLFFYPKAMTGGCTKQCKGFTALNAEFAKIDAVPIGISVDTLESQEKFTARDSLTIPLFADADADIAKKYGVLNPTRNLANRTTFVIDKKGVVRKIYKGVNPEKNPGETLDYIKENLSGK
jgi:peroxiredoxin Q/BCP